MDLEMAFGAAADLADDPEGFSKPGSCDPSLKNKARDAHRTTADNWTPLGEATARAIGEIFPETRRWTDAETEIMNCQPAVCDPATRDHLRALGVIQLAGRTADPFDALCAEPVVFMPGNRFEFARNLRDASGHRPAIIVPARDLYGDVIDLAAIDLNSSQVALWRERVPLLGGENVLCLRPRLEAPLAVHATPQAWLRANREGVFIVNYRRAADLLDGHSIAAECIEHGQRLRAALTRPAPAIVIGKAQA